METEKPAEIAELKYETRYALEWNCPDMTRLGFTIRTAHGDFEIGADEAPRIMDAVKQVLTERLAVLNAALDAVLYPPATAPLKALA